MSQTFQQEFRHLRRVCVLVSCECYGVIMRILNTSADRELLLVRSEYLWTLGFEVENAFANARLHEAVKQAGAVDLAVLCYTLSRQQKASLLKTIRENHPSTQVVELYRADDPVTEEAIDASGFRHMMKVLANCVGESGLASAGSMQTEYLNFSTGLNQAMARGMRS